MRTFLLRLISNMSTELTRVYLITAFHLSPLRNSNPGVKIRPISKTVVLFTARKITYFCAMCHIDRGAMIREMILDMGHLCDSCLPGGVNSSFAVVCQLNCHRELIINMILGVTAEARLKT